MRWLWQYIAANVVEVNSQGPSRAEGETMTKRADVLCILTVLFAASCGDSANEYGVASEELAVPFTCPVSATSVTVQRGVLGTVADTHMTAIYSAPGTGNMFVGSNSATASPSRALVRFVWPVGTIPAGAHIEDAVATFSYGKSSSANRTVRAHLVTSDWLENAPSWSTTYNADWDDPDGSFVASSWGPAAPGAVRITAMVQSWADGQPNNGVLLEQDPNGSSTSVVSSERSVVSQRPKLQICYSLSATPDASPPDAAIPDAAPVLPPDAAMPDANPPDATPSLPPTVDASAPAIDASPLSTPDASTSGSWVFDHNDTDLSSVSSACIDQLKTSTFIFHYAHRSHGSQIIVGANSLEAANPSLGFYARYCAAPSETNVLGMWDGMTPATGNLVEANRYWSTTSGLNELRSILNSHPEITYTSWAWSFEIYEQTAATVQVYLDTMSALEVEFPTVTFVYMTGPTVGYDNASHLNRVARNQQIRDFASVGGRVLFDFEDMDACWNGACQSSVISGVTVPMENPHYNLATPGNVEYQWTHTTRESCENKARAFWRMVAALEGCAP